MGWGGARPGSGRKKRGASGQVSGAETAPQQAAGQPVQPAAPAQPAGAEDAGAKAEGQAVADAVERTPLEFLKAIQNDPTVNLRDRIRCAITAAQYEHRKQGEGGKKEDAAERAKRAATSGRFGAVAPPPLRVVKSGG